MPPNLGGFFMVRSYYPSECHADYFDFERIEALKPAIEACGISTLSQSPMLGFHKQMDNRIKLLERSEERFSRNAETDLVCRLLLEKKILAGVVERLVHRPGHRVPRLGSVEREDRDRAATLVQELVRERREIRLDSHVVMVETGAASARTREWEELRCGFHRSLCC